MKHRLIEFPIRSDERGSLIAIEGIKDIPFEIKRVYYIFDTLNGVARGKHAHKLLEQIIVCVKGECKFLLDDGSEKATVKLDNPNVGLYLSSNIWREMYDFSTDCVLMVLASEHFEEQEYIRDYDEFLKAVNNGL